jgi:predicted RNA-binding Zn-ribbon protein involved in translation (DUF1610 family)
MRSYCVNGWNEDMDPKTGEFHYSCPECGDTEGTGHDESCSRYDPEPANNETGV